MQKLALDKIATLVLVLAISSVSIMGNALANGVDCSNFPRCAADEHIVQPQRRATLIYKGSEYRMRHASSHYEYYLR